MSEKLYLSLIFTNLVVSKCKHSNALTPLKGLGTDFYSTRKVVLEN